MLNIPSKFLPAALMDPTKSHQLVDKILDFNMPTASGVQLFFDWLEELAAIITPEQQIALKVLTGAVPRDLLNVP